MKILLIGNIYDGKIFKIDQLRPSIFMPENPKQEIIFLNTAPPIADYPLPVNKFLEYRRLVIIGEWAIYQYQP
jgi:hypothetical protein